jgi:hypothetical protein
MTLRMEEESRVNFIKYFVFLRKRDTYRYKSRVIQVE